MEIKTNAPPGQWSSGPDGIAHFLPNEYHHPIVSRVRMCGGTLDVVLSTYFRGVPPTPCATCAALYEAECTPEAVLIRTALGHLWLDSSADVKKLASYVLSHRRQLESTLLDIRQRIERLGREPWPDPPILHNPVPKNN